MAKKKKFNDDIDMKKDKGKGSALLIVFILVLIWLSAFAVLIKVDVGGIGTALRPYLKDVPVLSVILPAVSDKQIADENNYAYSDLGAAIARIEELSKENERLRNENEQLTEEITGLKDEMTRLTGFETNYDEFMRRVREFDKIVVFGEEAPDITEYIQFYETMYPENAEKMYLYALQLRDYDDGIKTQAEIFAAMKPATAAETLQEMTADMEWVVKIMLAMDDDARTAIFNKMDALYVARIMQTMSDMNEEKLQNLYDVLNTDYLEE